MSDPFLSLQFFFFYNLLLKHVIMDLVLASISFGTLGQLVPQTFTIDGLGKVTALKPPRWVVFAGLSKDNERVDDAQVDKEPEETPPIGVKNQPTKLVARQQLVTDVNTTHVVLEQLKGLGSFNGAKLTNLSGRSPPHYIWLACISICGETYQLLVIFPSGGKKWGEFILLEITWIVQWRFIPKLLGQNWTLGKHGARAVYTNVIQLPHEWHRCKRAGQENVVAFTLEALYEFRYNRFTQVFVFLLSR